jgi:hypothetical protein
MAIVALLADASENHLLYLCTQDGVVTSPPLAANGLVVIPNTLGGATPDLYVDSTLAAPNAAGAGGTPIARPIRARLTGYGAAAAGALNQAQARALFGCGVVGAVLSNYLVQRNRVFITPRNVAFAWAVDVNVDGQGDPTIEVRSATGTAGTAMLDVHASDPFG